MWACPNCGKQVNDNTKFCTFCGTSKAYPAQPQPLPAQPLVAVSQPCEPENSRYAPAAIERYQDAYRVARRINGIGQGIKLFGVLLSLLLIAAVVLAIKRGWFPERIPAGTVGIGIGTGVTVILILLFFWIIAIFIAASGQSLKAQLDDVVYRSPFLSDEQRAEAMSL